MKRARSSVGRADMGVAARGRCRRGSQGSPLRRLRSESRVPRVTQTQTVHSRIHTFTLGVTMHAFMRIESIARRFIHNQTRSRSDSHAPKLSYSDLSSSFVLCTLPHFGTPLIRFVAP